VKGLFHRKILLSRYQVVICALLIFWYISLFPARIGFDGSKLLESINAGQTVSTWSSGYYYFVQITSIGGRAVFLTSLITLLLLFGSLQWTIKKVFENSRHYKTILIIICITPYFSFTGLTLSHDVFLVMSQLLIIGYCRSLLSSGPSLREERIVIAAMLLFLNMFHSGILFCTLLCIIMFISKRKKPSIVLLILFLSLSGLLKLGVEQDKYVGELVGFVVSDLKCIAQHDENRLTEKDWSFLEQYGRKSAWEVPSSCARNDLPEGIFRSNISPSLDFYKEAFLILSKHPYLVIAAHVQRSAGVLPPPFFIGNVNQVDYSDEKPLGFGTNLALQNGPEIFHPSIDYGNVAGAGNKFSTVPELLALTMAFIFNQASWFWGWGGLWLWPIFIWTLREAKFRPKSDLIISFVMWSPILLQHIIIFVAAIYLPRYTIATIIMGLMCLTSLILKCLESIPRRIEPR
jgi:hypothetical protein